MSTVMYKFELPAEVVSVMQAALIFAEAEGKHAADDIACTNKQAYELLLHQCEEQQAKRSGGKANPGLPFEAAVDLLTQKSGDGLVDWLTSTAVVNPHLGIRLMGVFRQGIEETEGEGISKEKAEVLEAIDDLVGALKQEAARRDFTEFLSVIFNGAGQGDDTGHAKAEAPGDVDA